MARIVLENGTAAEQLLSALLSALLTLLTKNCNFVARRLVWL